MATRHERYAVTHHRAQPLRLTVSNQPKPYGAPVAAFRLPGSHRMKKLAPYLYPIISALMTLNAIAVLA